jgi:hypothetical protein
VGSRRAKETRLNRARNSVLHNDKKTTVRYGGVVSFSFFVICNCLNFRFSSYPYISFPFSSPLLVLPSHSWTSPPQKPSFTTAATMSLPTQTRQWLTTQSGISNLTLSSSPLPSPGPGEVLVKIHTVSLNYRDTEVIMGEYNHHNTTGAKPSALVPCSDMCGTILLASSPAKTFFRSSTKHIWKARLRPSI